MQVTFNLATIDDSITLLDALRHYKTHHIEFQTGLTISDPACLALWDESEKKIQFIKSIEKQVNTQLI